MAEVSISIKEKVFVAIKEYLLDNLKDRILGYKKLINDFEKIFSETGIDTIEKRLKVNIELKELIDSEYNFRLNESFSDEFPSYRIAIQAILSQLPNEQVEEQNLKHFEKDANDRLVIKIAKTGKNICQKAAWAIVNFENVFRKHKKAKTYFNRSIPTQNCYTYFIRTRYGKHVLESIKIAEQQILAVIDSADTICRNITLHAAHPLKVSESKSNQLSFGELSAKFDQIYLDLKTELEQKLHEEFKLLQIALNKVGTIELNASFFSEKLNLRREEQIDNQYKRWVKIIARNHKILRENWLLSHEINIFYESLKLAAKKVCKRLDSKIQKHVFKQIENLNVFLMESSLEFREAFSDKELLKTSILKERSRINGVFKKEIVPNSLHFMLFQNLPSVTLGLEHDIEKSLELINNSTAIKKDFKIEDKLSESDISTINPRELISFEYFKKLRDARDNIHNELVLINNKLQPSILEISNIHAYTFETAINNLEQGSATLKELDETIKQGFERAFEKIELLKNDLLSISEQAKSAMDVALNQLAEDLQYLNNSDNAFQLNLKLLENIARQRTQGYWQSLLNRLNNVFVWLVVKFNKVYKIWISLYKSTEQTLTQSETAELDDELTSFLANATSSYNKLPFIYRLLFRLEPLDDFNFYIERNFELTQLKNAFNAWETGQYASVLVVGSKGSGLTTLFNRFCQELTNDIQINRINPKDNVSDNAELIELLKATFNQSKFTTIEDVGDYLVNCGIKRVVLVDEFQRFFLRKINGFEVLNDMQKLIRISQSQVFWVVNLANISAAYLTKTTNIHDSFSWNISLRVLSQKDIEDLIMKRHRVSGYKLVFSESITNSTKKFQKLNPSQKQEFLKQIFFEKLSKHADGSLALALFLWILAIEIKDKQTIIVHPLINIYDVLKGLNPKKLNIIHALILHDGLTIKELNEVLNNHISDTRNLLSSLETDGIVSNKQDFLNINPLLYWSAIKALTKKNLIH